MKKNPENGVRPFSMRDKLGYTLGDLGCCCTEQFRGMWLSTFYILILQINPFHVATILLITKIWDAVNDPIIGAIVDSRNAPRGKKFIPWIRAFSFPMAVLCVLGFVNVSSWAYGLRIAYMFVSYILYEAIYTCVNVPFGTLSSVMTDDVRHRTALSRYRSMGGTIFMTVIVMVGPLVLFVDNQPVAGRFLMLASICALIGLLCLQVTCVWCKERVDVPVIPKEKRMKYGQVLREIYKNKALVGVMLFSLAGMIGASVVNGLNTYLFKDYFGNVKLGAVAGALSTLWAIIAFIITQPLANRFGKKEWCCMGAGFAAVVFAVLFFVPLHNPMAFILINGVCFLGASGMQVLVWAMVNDAIDYHELRTGERNEGIVYSTYSFFRKLAGAASASLSATVLGLIGYNQAEGAVQTEAVLGSLWKSYTGIYVLGYALAVVLLALIYPLTKQKTLQMLEELKSRRAAKAAGQSAVQG
ncbi:MAG: MFS transporter [Candidatus Limivicinus sp.]